PRAASYARRAGKLRASERLHHPLPCLLEGALLRRQRLLLALDGRFLVVLALPDLAQDASLLALLLEALHGVFERLAFLDAHARHSPNHHLPARERASGRNSASRKRGSISAAKGLSNLHAPPPLYIYSHSEPAYSRTPNDRCAVVGDAAGIRDGARRHPAHGDAQCCVARGASAGCV